jgi:hypothetical protein
MARKLLLYCTMPDELITVGVYETPLQAAIARNFLEAEGVPAYLADDATVGMAWHLTGAVGGVKLRVARDDAERAWRLLEELKRKEDDKAVLNSDGFADEPEFDAEEEDDEDDDDESALSLADDLADRAFRAAVLGLFLCPLQLYSLWLLASLLMLGQAPSPKLQKRAAIAGVLDIVFFVYLACLVMMNWS